MMNVSLKLEERLAVGGGKVKRLRDSGYVPAVFYGKQIDPMTVMVKASEFRDFLSKHGRNVVFNADLDNGKSFPALIKDIQMGVIKNEYVHVDFQQISLTEKVQMNVPVRLIGREAVERAEGIVVQQIDEVIVLCLAQDIPQVIDVDISYMGIGDSLTAGELKLPEGVTLVTEPDDLILSIASGMEEMEEETEDEDVKVEDGEASEMPEVPEIETEG